MQLLYVVIDESHPHAIRSVVTYTADGSKVESVEERFRSYQFEIEVID